MNRRHFLQGLAGIFAAGYAPAVFSSGIASGILMPVREIAFPSRVFIANPNWHAIVEETCVSLPAVPLVAQKIVVFNDTGKPVRVYAGGFDRHGRSAEGVYEIGSYEVFTFSPPAP